MVRGLQKILETLILKKRKEIPFIVFFSFLMTFLISRAVVYGIQTESIWFIDYVVIRGVHIHHFNFGILLLIITGFWALLDGRRNHLYIMSILYGIGLGLLMDEFGMIIMLDSNYWIQLSYYGVVTASAIFLNIIYFRSFWAKLGRFVLNRRMIRFLRGR